MEEEKKSLEFEIGEHVDCLDTVKKWCNAEIVAVYILIFVTLLETR
jgi:hypothetical protein